MIYYINREVKREFSVLAPVSDIFVSVSVIKTLTTFGIQTLYDMLQLGKDVICQLWGITDHDMKSIADLMDNLYFSKGTDRFIPIAAMTPELLEKEKEQTEVLSARLHRTSLEKLGLPAKLINALTRAGIVSVEELEETKDQLIKFPGIGKQSAEIIHNAYCTYLQKLFCAETMSEPGSPVVQMCVYFLQRLSNYFPVLNVQIYHDVLPYFTTADNGAFGVELKCIYKAPVLRKTVKKTLAGVINSSKFGVPMRTLRALAPDELFPTDVLQSVLHEMERDGWIEISDTVRLRYQPALQYIEEKVLDPRLYDILIHRIRGASLADLSEKHGVSGERIRQLTERWFLSKNVLLHEDRYVDVFKRYQFNKKEFMLVFSEPEETYHYLSMVISKKGSASYNGICEDPSLSPDLRAHIRKKLSEQDVIAVDDVVLTKQRRALLEHIVATQFQGGGTIDSLSKVYLELLKEYELEEDPALIMEGQNSFELQLNTSDMVLYKQGRQFRYYEIWENDYTELLQALNLEQYRDSNAEYSVKKFFDENLKTMESYDIRDEYELHNLLRKISSRCSLSYVTFQRMPIVSFGDTNTEKQIGSFLLKHAPISKKLFISLYEQTYGIRIQPNAKCLEPFARYYNGRVYDFAEPALSPDQCQQLKSVLALDCYRLSEIQEICKKLFSSEADHASLELIGYQVYGDMILSDRWNSSSEYYLHLLTQGDIVDLGQIPSFVQTRKQFYVTIHNLEKEGKLLRYGEKTYLTEKGMETYSLTSGDIFAFRVAVQDMTPEGVCFTIAQLRKQNPQICFPGEKIDDKTYGAMLAGDENAFSSAILAGTRILCRGRSKDPATDLILQILQKHGSVTIDQVSRYLKVEYELDCDKVVLSSKIRRSNLYLDRATRMVYSSADEYRELTERNGE